MTLTDATTPSNTTDLLSLKPSSTAAGVKLRILKSNSNPVFFGPDSAVAGWPLGWRQRYPADSLILSNRSPHSGHCQCRCNFHDELPINWIKGNGPAAPHGLPDLVRQLKTFPAGALHWRNKERLPSVGNTRIWTNIERRHNCRLFVLTRLYARWAYRLLCIGIWLIHKACLSAAPTVLMLTLVNWSVVRFP